MAKPGSVNEVVAGVNWALLAEQKKTLLAAIRWLDENGTGRGIIDHMDGILALIDRLQDAAERDGYPVVWLETKDEE